jgi:hypothetical protein
MVFKRVVELKSKSFKFIFAEVIFFYIFLPLAIKDMLNYMFGIDMNVFQDFYLSDLIIDVILKYLNGLFIFWVNIKSEHYLRE